MASLYLCARSALPRAPLLARCKRERPACHRDAHGSFEARYAIATAAAATPAST